MQKHWDVMRTDNAGELWREMSGNLPTDFTGFAIDVHAPEAETIYVVPIKSDSETFPARREAARVSEPDRRRRMEAAHKWAAAGKDCYVNVLPRRHGGGFDGFLRRVFRHQRAGKCTRHPMAAH